jgi:hypothetical protein
MLHNVGAVQLCLYMKTLRNVPEHCLDYVSDIIAAEIKVSRH